MSSHYGENIRLTVFGQSHSPAIGVTVEGLPAGETVDFDRLQQFLNRRAAGNNAWSTARHEPDCPEFLSGVVGNRLCGTPLTAIIRNTNTRSADYDDLCDLPRPGHADYTAHIKYHGAEDRAGGGHFSGRMTAPLCVAGGICLQLLKKENITVISRIVSIGGVRDESALLTSTAEKPFPVSDDKMGEKMIAAIEDARKSGDSVGGVIECAVLGLPAGLGDPMFDGMENRIAKIVFGVPAVKGIEFGNGFAAADLRGSQNNDVFVLQDGAVATETNRCGGILGGITNGMPLVFRVAVKPTPSIAAAQQTLNTKTLERENLEIKGRHDPCIVPRAVPVLEAVTAVAVYDALFERKKEI